MSLGTHKLIPASFSAVPSLDPSRAVGVLVVTDLAVGLDAVGYLVGPTGDLPEDLAIDRDALTRSGFDAKAGQSILLPQLTGPQLFLVGTGPSGDLTEAGLRDAAATFARAAHRHARIGLYPGAHVSIDAAQVGQALTEGVLLARYRYTALKPSSTHVPLISLDILATPEDAEGVTTGAHAGEIMARAANLARDLANTPPGHLTATDIADLAVSVGGEHSLEVTVFDKQQIIDLGCGGLLGVNAGSVEEPRIVKLVYTPEPTADGVPPAHLALVGKGIMYDSGGISLKPSDPMHLAMKMDMAGAAAVFAAMMALRDVGCATAVTAFLMCTDNMPSGSAMKLGDVLTIRGGTTVEVKNTDAEGRLVLADGLVLAVEDNPDAIVDIATLTGAALAALGMHTAAVFGTSQPLIDQASAAGAQTDESIWQLPLEKRYRSQLDSEVADMSNMGGKYAGATIAALFMADFVGEVPWAHLDIAGTMQAEKDESWRSQGATGFGTRLLIELASNFLPVAPAAP
ncbi:leucyl aminopeptidase [Cryobacterium arcticum]|uniref:Probable cytosol aminopeptidase n=1 Tax=Cryobacterium arcticum TaxID=670052 RepID=A0A318A1X6_9MICO|nr:leucyl aminopeptidase [Cryobacterium arcticum]PXA71948.1 leucyl aminopeptidase [Cryobacterium arcticum]